MPDQNLHPISREMYCRREQWGIIMRLLLYTSINVIQVILQHNTCSLFIIAETLRRLVTKTCASLPSTELMVMGRYQLSRGQFFPYSRSRKVSQPSSSQVRQEAGRVIIAGKKVEKTAHEFSSLTSNDPSSFNNS